MRMKDVLEGFIPGYKILASKFNNQIRRKPSILKMTIAVTFLCDSKCKTCNIWEIYKNNPERLKEELTLDDYVRLFLEEKNNLLWIEFTGGEPFLRKDLADIVLFAFNNTSLLAGGLTTNGLNPNQVIKRTERIVKKIPENKKLTVGVSVDGVPEDYVKIRGIDGFYKAIETFLKLKDLQEMYPNLFPHIAYTISSYNAGKLENFFRYMKENYKLFIEDFSFSIEHYSNYYMRGRNSSVDNQRYNQLIARDVSYILQLIDKCNVSKKDTINYVKRKFYKFYLKKIPEFLKNGKKMVIPCAAGTYSTYIDPYGNVYPCTMLNYPLGNIKDNELHKIWYSPTAEKVRNTIKKGECPNCWTPCEAQPSWVMNFGLVRGWW